MTYNFTDNPSPTLSSIVNEATGLVGLKDGPQQGDLITTNFAGDRVAVSIAPPEGWTLDDVVWTTGGTGVFDVPAAGQEHSHNFVYTVSQNGTSQTHGGSFKIKKNGPIPT